jgi:O-antigen ligase
MSSTAPPAESEGPVSSPGRTLAGRTRGFTPERALRISVMVVGLMWTLPFLVPLKAPPIPSFHAEALAAVLGLVALSALPVFASRLELPRVALLPLGFTGLIIAQMVFGRLPYHQVGLLAALYLLWATGLVMLGGLLRRELGLARVAGTLAWFLLVGALASAFIAWVQHIDSDALGRLIMPRSPGRVWANLGQSNQLADYLALGLASVGYLYASDRLALRWGAPATLALAYILGLTGSRTAWVYLAGLVALSAGFWGLDRSRSNRRLLGLCSLALAACILLPWLVGDLTTAASRLGGSEIGAEERLRIWRAAILMLRDSPLFGIGFRQFGWHHFALNAQMPQPRMLGFTDHAHNLLLHVLAEFGLVGFALLAGFALLWVAGLVRQPRTPAHWWIWAVALVLGVHSMLEYPLWYAFFLGVTAVVLGLGEPNTLRLQLGQSGRTGRLLFVGLLALGWFVAGQLIRDYMVLENFLAFRYRYMHASAELNRQAKDALLEIHRGSLLAQYVELGLARTISVDTDRLADKFAVNSRAMRLFPIDDVTYRQAMLLALRGDQAAARRQWDLAVASFPELRESATLVVKRRVEDGLAELRPLLEYAQKPNHHEPAEGGAN